MAVIVLDQGDGTALITGASITENPVDATVTVSGFGVSVVDLGDGTSNVFGGLSLVDNGDGTVSIFGATVVDNGDGTASVYGQGVVVVDNGDGTATISQGLVPLLVTVEPDSYPPRIRLDITAAAGSSVQVTRTSLNGTVTPVRGGNPAVSGGLILLYDYETPYNEPVTYQAGTLTAPAVTLPVYRSWLIHPGVPSLSQPITALSPVSDETRESTAGIHQIVGRSAPIIVTDGRRKSVVFTLGVMTDTQAAEDGFEGLIADSSPLLLQLVDSGRSRYRWISIGSVVMSTPGAWLDPTRIWGCPCVVIDRPVGDVRSPRTWQTVIAEAPTWAGIKTKYATWHGVLTGDPGL